MRLLKEARMKDMDGEMDILDLSKVRFSIPILIERFYAFGRMIRYTTFGDYGDLKRSKIYS